MERFKSIDLFDRKKLFLHILMIKHDVRVRT